MKDKIEEIEHVWIKTPVEVLERLSETTLRKFIKASQCLACGCPGVDIAHVKSKGSGGPMVAHNLIPLCRACHSFQHANGWMVFLDKYTHVGQKLVSFGWRFEYSMGKFKMTYEGRENENE